MDIRKRHPVSKKYSKKTRIVNLYDNKISKEYLWQRLKSEVYRALQDISWMRIICGQVLIIGDINANSFIRNPHYWQIINARSIEKLIESYELLDNNDTNFSTRLSF